MEWKFLLEMFVGIVAMAYNFYLFLELSSAITLFVAIGIGAILFILAYREDVKEESKWYSKDYIDKHKVRK